MSALKLRNRGGKIERRMIKQEWRKKYTSLSCKKKIENDKKQNKTKTKFQTISKSGMKQSLFDMA